MAAVAALAIKTQKQEKHIFGMAAAVADTRAAAAAAKTSKVAAVKAFAAAAEAAGTKASTAPPNTAPIVVGTASTGGAAEEQQNVKELRSVAGDRTWGSSNTSRYCTGGGSVSMSFDFTFLLLRIYLALLLCMNRARDHNIEISSCIGLRLIRTLRRGQSTQRLTFLKQGLFWFCETKREEYIAKSQETRHNPE
jgi:hypothetical protein